MKVILFALSIVVLPLCAQSTLDSIRREPLLANSETNRPLPLVGSWDAGWCNVYSLQWELAQIQAGHHLLPWIWFPPPDTPSDWAAGEFQSALRNLADLRLPLVLVGTQWEEILYTDAEFFSKPAGTNANVILAGEGRLIKKLSPFGDPRTWNAAGRKWTASGVLRDFQRWYPDPPLIIFLSNNEAEKLDIWEAEQDQRYLDLYGIGRDDAFKRQVFYLDGWRPRYEAMRQGMLDGLVNESWKTRARFVGFDITGPWWFGMYENWQKYSSYMPGRISAGPLYWDGGSEELYQSPSDEISDFRVYSPQIYAMNMPFLVSEAIRLRPEFWFEISTWDGDDAKRNWYRSLGQTYSPERYGGMVQFNMWVTHPRVVREFHNDCSVTPWIDAIIASVDRIYTDPTLQRFWRQGKLVPNPALQHPYTHDIPDEYAGAHRMFLLTTNFEPRQPWLASTELPVFSIAHVIGEPPAREWLLYLFSPRGDRSGVRVTIPDYREITAGATVAGAFYLIEERSGSVTLLDSGANRKVIDPSRIGQPIRRPAVGVRR